MPHNKYDVIVIGLGIMGASTVYQLAKRGSKVLGIDRFSPPHNFGSSHGDTRITRRAVGEGEMYMPFIQRSHEIWQELEEATGQQLYVPSGGLIIEPIHGGAQFHANRNFISRTSEIATHHNIEHHIWNADETTKQYPQLKLRQQDRTYFEPNSGVLRPELCIQTQLEQAIQFGATIHTNESMADYHATKDGVCVTTDKDSYEADKIVVAIGAWILDVLPQTHQPTIEIYRQVIYWFESDNLDQFSTDNFPFVIWIGDTMEEFFTVFPIAHDSIQGIKVMTEQYSRATTPQTLDRTVHSSEINYLYQLTHERLYGVHNKLVHADVCMYTLTPDEHFILDFHPESDRVVIASPCSGHGFKHSAAVGETLAEMALGGTSTLDIHDFSLARLIK